MSLFGSTPNSSALGDPTPLTHTEAKVTICGALGRMGKELCKEFTSDSDLFETSSTKPQLLRCRPNPASSTVLVLYKRLLRKGTWHHNPNEHTTDDPSQAFHGADVVIDFTPNVAQHCREAQKQGCSYLCGTTDLTPHDQEALQEAAKQVPVLWAANFSEGLMIINALLAQASAMTKGSAWDITISETHHQNKKDKPSGTALSLGQSLNKNRERKIPQEAYVSLRGGAVAGRHTVGFHNNVSGEEFFITHEAHHRALFAKRALYCAEWLYTKKITDQPGYYGIDSVA